MKKWSETLRVTVPESLNKATWKHGRSERFRAVLDDVWAGKAALTADDLDESTVITITLSEHQRDHLETYANKYKVPLAVVARAILRKTVRSEE